MQGNCPTEEQVREALRAVDDPEIGVNIVDLGLVYRIEIDRELVRIEMTMTTPACPMGGLIADEVRRAVRALVRGGADVVVDLVWDPPWSPERMSASARQSFGWSA